MSKYLKLFETTSQYNEYINGSDVVLPNVSVAKDSPKTVYFNPYVPMNIITYEATAKLEETTASYLPGIHTNAFSGKSGQLTITSHTFENGIGTIEFDGDVTGIGDSAFFNCRDLTSVTIPDGVTSIGGNAFDGCKGLTSVTIGSGVTSIGKIAFFGCSGLTSIVVDSANTVYDSRDNCNAIINTSTNELIAGCKNTVIPDTVTSISERAFGTCTGLTSITIPNSVTSIGIGAFINCKGLTSVIIGNSVTSIDYDAFYGCSGLTSITSLAAKAPTIQSDTFSDIKTGGTLTVPIGSTGYDVWMGRGSYYLGYYNWTKKEQ